MMKPTPEEREFLCQGILPKGWELVRVIELLACVLEEETRLRAKLIHHSIDPDLD